MLQSLKRCIACKHTLMLHMLYAAFVHCCLGTKLLLCGIVKCFHMTMFLLVCVLCQLQWYTFKCNATRRLVGVEHAAQYIPYQQHLLLSGQLYRVSACMEMNKRFSRCVQFLVLA